MLRVVTEIIEFQNNFELKGNVHDILTFFPNLITLDISTTDIGGSIPSSVADHNMGDADTSNNSSSMKHLQNFRAIQTSMTGTIPTEIGLWTNLCKYDDDVCIGGVKYNTTFCTFVIWTRLYYKCHFMF